MILEPKETFGDWVKSLRIKLQITDDAEANVKAGVYLYTIRTWEKNTSLPQVRTLLRLTENLSKTTGESPQDILDTIMESIPEWRRINK